MPTCSEGHVTPSDDYCDVCGSPVTTPTAPAISPSARLCPSCQAPITGRFCEACGHDSSSPDPLPQPQSAGSAVWTAVVAADRDYHKRVVARGGPDTVDFPEFFPERRITLRDNTLIGRANRRQGVQPGIDLGIHPVDRGVSTQHAVLRIRDSVLTVTDLGSTNGTSLNDGDDLLTYGEEIPLADGDRIHVGAWTTITVAKSQKDRP
jgi:FHA domain